MHQTKSTKRQYFKFVLLLLLIALSFGQIRSLFWGESGKEFSFGVPASADYIAYYSSFQLSATYAWFPPAILLTTLLPLPRLRQEAVGG